MTGQIVAFSAFGIPLVLSAVFGAPPGRVLLVGAGLAAGFGALAATSPTLHDSSEVAPLWFTALLVLGLMLIWCAGVAVGSTIRRRLDSRRA
jgi:hypothetical protein